MTQAKEEQALIQKLEARLQGFSSAIPEGTDFWNFQTYKIERDEIPVPELVLFLLHNIMGYSRMGPFEKVRWSVGGSFQGIPIAFELRKFGFKLCYPPGESINKKRIIGQIRSALGLIEKPLQDVAESEISQGNVIIENQYGEYDARYRFFRNKADESFQRSNERHPPISEDGSPSLSLTLNHFHNHAREGFFYSTAMMDAFFSRLEHLFILLRAFSGKPLAEGTLIEYFGAKWGDKMRALIDIESSRPHKLLYDKLKRLKERIRNPLAHGGFEKDGGSMQIFIPSIGSIPANLSKIQESVSLNLFPVDHNEHQYASQLFDEFDAFLISGELRMPMALIAAGVDPAFDNDSLQRYSEAIQSEETLERFVRHWSEQWELHTNMDY